MQRCSATAAAPAAAGHLATADVPVEAARRPAINQAADLNTILEERDACGVRLYPSHVSAEEPAAGLYGAALSAPMTTPPSALATCRAWTA